MVTVTVINEFVTRKGVKRLIGDVFAAPEADAEEWRAAGLVFFEPIEDDDVK